MIRPTQPRPPLPSWQPRPRLASWMNGEFGTTPPSETPKPTLMPSWMWTVGCLCLGALGYAALTAHLIIFFPLAFVAWKFFGLAAEQRETRKKLAAAEAQLLAITEAELDKEIGGPDAELEAKFKALEIATGVPVALDDPPEVDGMTMIGTGGLPDRVRETQQLLLEPDRKGYAEERTLRDTVRKVILRGNIACTLRRRPGRRSLIVRGSMADRRSLQTHLVNEVLHITFDSDKPGALVRVELCSAALNTVDIQGGEAHIQGTFEDLALTVNHAGGVYLEGTVTGFYLTTSKTSIHASLFDSSTTHLCCQDTALHLSTPVITGVLLDNKVTLRSHNWRPVVNVQGSFASFKTVA